MVSQAFQQLCQQVPEIQLYYIINTKGGFIWGTNHEMADGRLKSTPEIEAALKLAQEEIEHAVDQTKRFGITAPRDENGKATKEYWAWFNKWDSYTKSLSPDQQDDVFTIFDGIGRLIDTYRPPTA